MTQLERSAQSRSSRNVLVGGIAIAGLPFLLWARTALHPVAISDDQDAVRAAGALAAAQSADGIDRSWRNLQQQAPTRAASGSENCDAPVVWSGKEAIRRSFELLQDGRGLLDKTECYTATFYRQELVHGKLRDPEAVNLKVRREPFSVYMKWIKGYSGQELLYVEGQHDDKLMVHPGGWKSRLIPVLKLDPHGSMALAKSRYPIHQVGMQPLTEKLLDYRREDLERTELPECRLVDGQTLGGRDCYFFVVEYPSRSMSELYRKTLLYIDKEWSLPISIRNYTWHDGDAEHASDSEIDEQTLIEHYAYTDVSIDPPLAERDFDPENEAYCFRR